jgi:hypothetical protein
LGVLSIHFPEVRRPTDIQTLGMMEAANLAANAIIRLRAFDDSEKMFNSLDLLRKSRQAIVNAEKLLSRARCARIG